MSAALFFVFLTSLVLTAAWLRHSLRRNRLDIPNARSSHSRPTPTSGGVGFCVVSLLGVLALWWNSALSGLEAFLFLLGAPVALFGLLDDSHDLGIRVRLSVQMIVVALLVALAPQLPPLGFGPWQLEQPLLLSWLLFSYGIWQINFYNFMDGIDGLAVGQGLFVSLSLAWFCGTAGAPSLSVVALGLACAMAAFVPFNMPAAWLFMGDVGSNFLGYVFLVLGVLVVCSGAVSYWTYLILMSAFLIDSTVTLIARMHSGAVWYHGHRTHAYQLAARRIGSHGRVVMVYMGVNLAWLLPLAALSRQYADHGLWIALLAWTPLALATWLVRRRFKEQDQATDMSK